MFELRVLPWLIAFVLILSACSIEINQDSTATPFAPQPLAVTPAFSTAAGPATPNAPASALPSAGAIPIPSNSKIPVTWSNLNLTGKLVFISGGEQVDNLIMTIQMLDLKTGQINIVFQGSDNSWIYSVTVSPDGKQLVMSYSPPPAQDIAGNPTLYIMPMDGSKPPQLLFTPSSNHDEYFQPDWSADGKYIYFTRINREVPTKAGELYSDFQVYRMAYPDGQLQGIADEAFWPRVSADSTKLVYVKINPTDSTNKLFLSNMDGSNAHEVVMSGPAIPNIIDAPIFSPDGRSILFSAVTLFQSSAPTWLEKILGVTVASAHSIPSEWWSVPFAGGTPIQLTHIQATGLFASISPDKKYIASYSGFGLFAMNPDGTGQTMLINSLGGVPSTVSWIP